MLWNPCKTHGKPSLFANRLKLWTVDPEVFKWALSHSHGWFILFYLSVDHRHPTTFTMTGTKTKTQVMLVLLELLAYVGIPRNHNEASQAIMITISRRIFLQCAEELSWSDFQLCTTLALLRLIGILLRCNNTSWWALKVIRVSFFEFAALRTRSSEQLSQANCGSSSLPSKRSRFSSRTERNNISESTGKWCRCSSRMWIEAEK